LAQALVNEVSVSVPPLPPSFHAQAICIR